MQTKKDNNQKSVHRFTENALMKFSPLHYIPPEQPKANGNTGIISKMSNIFGGFFKGSNNNVNKSSQKSSITQAYQYKNNKSNTSIKGGSKSMIQIQNQDQQGKELSRVYSGLLNFMPELLQNSRLTFLQRINPETFLIGNINQLDLISIVGVYENSIDTDLNWSLSIQKKIKKIAIDPKKMLLAIEAQSQILVFKYDLRKMKEIPLLLNKVRIQSESRFIHFLKDSQFCVLYDKSLQVFQLQESNTIKKILDKKYGTGPNLFLFQVPKPIQNCLNIFFNQPSEAVKINTLWRLQLNFKSISSSDCFKPLMRIYDIPNNLMHKFKIDNHSRDTFIMNFQYEIYAAKDGYIIDNINVNIQEDNSCLIYRGEHLLIVSSTKLDIYNFKIISNVKPNKIVLSSVDSIQINKDPNFKFIDCLEMLNGNFVLFFQIKPQANKKTKGEIQYMITVTQKQTITEKLSQIFSFKSPKDLRKIAKRNYALIEQRCDVAFKIGLNRKQVYLQLWNRSAKSTVTDYKFLLDTLDYDTIKQEIQKRLKKSSMQFRQVYKLQQGCFGMLSKQLFGNSNTSEHCIKNYIKSHFLLRKLQFFRDVQALHLSQNELYEEQSPQKRDNEQSQKSKKKKVENQQSEDSEQIQEKQDAKKQKLNIDIQQYFSCTNMQLKTHFLQLASKLCIEDKPVADQLRLFIRSFKFPLRIIYSKVLEDLIILSKTKLIKFLKAMPEILPYTYLDIPDCEDPALYKGICQPISPAQWTKNLHIEEISTIYNKTNVQQLTKTVWFKRNQYTLHDLIPLSKQKILEIQDFNASAGIFYFFIEKIFQHCHKPKDQEEVVLFLQSNYEQLPHHLKGKIFLYRDLYQYFINERYTSPAISNFNTFLKMQDYEVFRELFRYQKIKKGCLLKDVKAIYNLLPGGNQIYNQSLLQYFKSSLSEISDLKCILNRLNNEKLQFHSENEGIYKVLVQGMSTKLKLGSDNDIPLQEVMIYVENIPLSKQNPAIEDLKVVQKINEEAIRFKRMKLNLSFLQIIERMEYVVSAMINQQIEDRQLMSVTNEEDFMNKTYEILAEVQIVKQKIYKDKSKNIEYFIYLNKLLQRKEMIEYAKLVLADPHLAAEYPNDQFIMENMVLYMVKWRLEQRNYIDHYDYLMELYTILPESNLFRKFLQAQTQFAIMLSSPDHPVEYPLAAPVESENQNETISIRLCEIQALFEHLSSEFIMNLNIERLYELVKEMELFYEQEIILIEDLYQIIIKRLIELRNVREAISIMRKSFELRGQNQSFSVVFCFLIMDIIVIDIPDNHRKDLAKIAFYTFSHPLEMVEAIERRINNTMSNDEEQEFLNEELEKVRHRKCYDPNNILLDHVFLQKVQQKEEKYYHQFESLIFQTWDRLASCRDDFTRSYDFTWIFIMLLHNPYALSKYLLIKKHTLNIRIVRSYLSYVFKEEIFNGVNVLRFAKRVFTIALESLETQLTVQYITSQFKGIKLQEDEHIDLTDKEDSSLQSKIIKSIKAFTKKLSTIKVSSPKPEELDRKKRRIESLLKSEVGMDLSQSQYPFQDSDDNYENKEEQQQQKKLEVKSTKKQKGDKKLLRERQQKNLALFLSTTGEDRQMRRSTPHQLKTSLTFHNQYQSVHFSKKQNKEKTKRKNSVDNKATDLNIVRTESIQSLIDEEDRMTEENEIYKSQNPNDNTKKVQDQQLYVSLEYKPFFRPTLGVQQMPWTTKSYSPNSSQNQVCSSEIESPLHHRLVAKNSLVDVDIVDDEEKQPQEDHGFNFNYTVNVQEINDQDYTPARKLIKQLTQDYGDSEAEPVFNLSLIEAEKQKQFDHFQHYLREVISAAYEWADKPLSLMFHLIKQIQAHYPEIHIQSDFLKVYIALENYNTKYKYNLPIRQMFPIEGIFLQSSDLKELFQFVKERILSYVDFDNILVVAKVVHFSFQKSDIKDELYYSYLCHAIEQYGNDTFSAKDQLLMQKQRIGGIIEQVILVNIFIERGHALLSSISIPERRQEIASIIKQALRKKKKEALMAELDKIVASL